MSDFCPYDFIHYYYKNFTWSKKYRELLYWYLKKEDPWHLSMFDGYKISDKYKNTSSFVLYNKLSDMIY